MLPKRIDGWSLMSLRQRLGKTGGRLIKHARYYGLLLAESHLTRRLCAAMVRRVEALPVAAGQRLCLRAKIWRRGRGRAGVREIAGKGAVLRRPDSECAPAASRHAYRDPAAPFCNDSYDDRAECDGPFFLGVDYPSRWCRLSQPEAKMEIPANWKLFFPSGSTGIGGVDGRPWLP